MNSVWSLRKGAYLQKDRKLGGKWLAHAWSREASKMSSGEIGSNGEYWDGTELKWRQRLMNVTVSGEHRGITCKLFEFSLR